MSGFEKNASHFITTLKVINLVFRVFRNEFNKPLFHNFFVFFLN